MVKHTRTLYIYKTGHYILHLNSINYFLDEYLSPLTRDPDYSIRPSLISGPWLRALVRLSLTTQFPLIKKSWMPDRAEDTVGRNKSWQEGGWRGVEWTMLWPSRLTRGYKTSLRVREGIFNSRGSESKKLMNHLCKMSPPIFYSSFFKNIGYILLLNERIDHKSGWGRRVSWDLVWSIIEHPPFLWLWSKEGGIDHWVLEGGEGRTKHYFPSPPWVWPAKSLVYFALLALVLSLFF